MSIMHRQDAGSRLATRIVFLVAGFGVACWAPLVPLAKARLGIGDASLGLLLLCLGLGSVLAMQLAGPLMCRIGARPVIVAGGLGLAMLLPLLSVATTAATMATLLLLFGGCLGSIDVGMNLHAIEVERRAARPLMSGFHALFSLGGFAGSLMLTTILSTGIGPLSGTIAASVPMVVAVLLSRTRLIDTPKAERTTLLVVPRGIVLLLALLCAVTFLTEGAMLDWGALLLSGRGLLSTARAGIGYSAFAVAMTAGRLAGDAVVARLGDRRVLLWGGVVAMLGFVVLLTAPIAAAALAGLILIGLGAANMVPILFRQAGAQRRMPAGLAIGAVTSVGYAGVLAGPALVGFVAQTIGLAGAVWVLAVLLGSVPLSAVAVTRARPGGTDPAQD